jgi:hypothetical protein
VIRLVLFEEVWNNVDGNGAVRKRRSRHGYNGIPNVGEAESRVWGRTFVVKERSDIDDTVFQQNLQLSL